MEPAVRAMLSLALPVVATYLGIMLMNVVDLLFVGRVSSVAVGAVGVGSSFFSWGLVFGLGLLSALDYAVSNAVGAGRKSELGQWMIQGILLAIGVSVPGTVLLWVVSQNVSFFGVQPEVAVEVGPYLSVLAVSLLPVLVFTAIRLALQAAGSVAPSLWVLVGANILNVALNALLVPSKGAWGSALATTTARTAMALALILYAARLAPLSHWFDIQRDKLSVLWKVGFPAALQFMFEVGVFATSTTLAGRFSAPDLAGFQIVLSTASVTFMVPMGIGASTAVLVGQALGEGKRAEAFARGWRGLALGAGCMAFLGVGIALLRGVLAEGFTTDLAARASAAPLFIVAALFQLSDGTQVVAAGALRGLGKTRGSMIANCVGHWGVGLPLGVYLGFYLGYGVLGLWIGLAVGLTVVAAALVALWWHATTR